MAKLPGMFTSLSSKHFETSTHVPLHLRHTLTPQRAGGVRKQIEIIPSSAPQTRIRFAGHKADFELWTVARNYSYRGVFEDVVSSVAASLRQLGYSVHQTYGAHPRGAGRQVIVFGANVLQNKNVIPPGAVIYQLEQFVPRWMNSVYLDCLKSRIVWDFSQRNVEKFREFGMKNVHLCRVGARPSLPKKTTAKKDIDVLFYGSWNARRKAVLNALRARGLKVHDIGGWGSKRQQNIARAKVLLNIHYYDTSCLEVVRLMPALEQGAFVVSETGSDAAMDAEFADGIVFAPYSKLVETVLAQVRRPQAERDQMVANALATIQKFPHKGEIERCIAESLPQMKHEPPPVVVPAEPKRVKCFINNRNRLTWMKALAEQIIRLGGEPIIVDNASTYPPLVEWYNTQTDYRVVRLKKNMGSRAPWVSGTIAKEVARGELYVVTDPDLDLSAVPADCLKVLERGLNKYGRQKAGLSLEINDIHPEIAKTVQKNKRTLRQCEEPYWRKRLDAQFWDAATDTTFALYRNNGPVVHDNGTFYKAVRSDRPYTAKHLPWYKTEKEFDDEDRFYVAHREQTKIGNIVTNGCFYDSIQSKQAKVSATFKGKF